MGGVILSTGGGQASASTVTTVTTVANISILRQDPCWIIDGWQHSYYPLIRSIEGGELATGSLEFGYFYPSADHNKLMIALSGGLASDPTLKIIQFVSESNIILASYTAANLQGPRIVNEYHIHHRFGLPLHASREKFKIRLTDNDNGGADGGWSWFSTMPEFCILSV